MYFVGRLAYSLGYTQCGPQGRLIGVLLIDLAHLAGLVMVVIAVIQMMLAADDSQDDFGEFATDSAPSVEQA